MKNYWDNYYKKIKGNLKPTSFSKRCKKILKGFRGKIYDIGCGNGRDTIYFNRNDFDCYGIDQSAKAIKLNKLRFKKYSKNFIKGNFVNYSFQNSKKKFALYSRFTIHSINKDQEKLFFKRIHKLKNLDYIFIEVRTIYDELFGKGKKIKKNAYLTTHYRRFINPPELRNEVKKSFKILEYKVSRGLAVYKNENPRVLRIIGRKRNLK